MFPEQEFTGAALAPFFCFVFMWPSFQEEAINDLSLAAKAKAMAKANACQHDGKRGRAKFDSAQEV